MFFADEKTPTLPTRDDDWGALGMGGVQADGPVREGGLFAGAAIALIGGHDLAAGGRGLVGVRAIPSITARSLQLVGRVSRGWGSGTGKSRAA